MTLERALTVLIVIGRVLDRLLRAAFWVLGRLIVLVFFLLLLGWGATRTGRQAEYRTRPN